MCRVHSLLRVTPAIEDRITDHVWGGSVLIKLGHYRSTDADQSEHSDPHDARNGKRFHGYHLDDARFTQMKSPKAGLTLYVSVVIGVYVFGVLWWFSLPLRPHRHALAMPLWAIAILSALVAAYVALRFKSGER